MFNKTVILRLRKSIDLKELCCNKQLACSCAKNSWFSIAYFVIYLLSASWSILLRVVWHNRTICDNHIHINQRCCHSSRVEKKTVLFPIDPVYIRFIFKRPGLVPKKQMYSRKNAVYFLDLNRVFSSLCNSTFEYLYR